MPGLTSGFVALGLVLSLVTPGFAFADPSSDQIAPIVARVLPAVVEIIAVQPLKKSPEKPTQNLAGAAEEDQDDKPVTAEGSGFLIDPSGFIATNKHVVEDAVSLFVVTGDGVHYKARIVGLTSKADIALLKIHSDKPFPVVKFGDSDKMRPGDTVFVIGSPFGFQESVSAGIVSAVNRNIMESPFDDYIQTDAAINHGNSGGPLFNLSGEVIGMNSVLYAPGSYSGSAGLGFAIPSDELRFVYNRLMATGKISAGMLPIWTEQVNWMLAKAIGAPGLNGALVTAVAPGGEAMMKGQIKPGDIVLAFNGQPVADPRDLDRKAAQTAIGSDATLDILHDGQHRTVHVPIQAWPEGTVPVVSDATPDHLGLTLTAGSHGGVVVASIDPSGSAASSGIQKGDIIQQVRTQSASDPAQVLRALKPQSPDKRQYAAVLVDRNGKPTWIALPIPQ